MTNSNAELHVKAVHAAALKIGVYPDTFEDALAAYLTIAPQAPVISPEEAHERGVEAALLIAEARLIHDETGIRMMLAAYLAAKEGN